MGQRRLFLAIDQGSHASRAIVFDATGAIQASAEAEIDVRKPRPGWVEHDPRELIDATRQVIDDVARDLGGDGRHVQSAGFATQRSSIACWDRSSGEPISPILSWQDRRAADWLQQFEAREAEVHAITGLVLSPHYGASKLRWCLEHLPAVAEAHEEGRLAFGPLSSFLTHQLCVEHPCAADPANASRTLLWDYRRGDWSEELLGLFGLPRECLPLGTSTRHPYGHLRLGQREVPVTIVTGDQSAALFGFGAPTPDTVYANLGTGAFLQQVVDGAPVSAPGLLSSIVYQDEQRSTHVLEGTVNGAGSAIRAVAKELNIDQDDVEAGSARWLETIDQPPLFLNGVGGLGAPFWIADFPTRFVGDGSDAAKIVAVMESIVFLLLTNLEAFGAHTPRPTRMLVTGGLASVDPLCQRLADLSGLPVIRPRIREATARGLAWLLTDRKDSWTPQSASPVLEPAVNRPLLERFRRWQRAMLEIVDGRE